MTYVYAYISRAKSYSELSHACALVFCARFWYAEFLSISLGPLQPPSPPIDCRSTSTSHSTIIHREAL